jgi:chromosomal replication initiator protein
MRDARLLIIDDVQRIAGKKATEEECFDTIAAVLERGGQVVLTALTGASGLNGFGERLAHHLKCATEVEIGMPDALLRREILDARVACYAEEEPSFEVEPRALDIIAERMAVSGRELDGAVRQLFLEWMDKRMPVSWEMAELALRSKIGAGEKRITLDMIKQATCKHFEMSVAELLRKTRETSVAYPRQVAMYLCAKQTTLSLPNIARMFGGFDHTTVLHARRKVEELLRLQEADARGEAPSDRKLVRHLPLAHQCRKDVDAIHRLLRQPT